MTDGPEKNLLTSLTVRTRSLLAKDIISLELVHQDGADLPAFTAGAHIAVQTPGGAMRHYSLSNDPVERHRYVLGIKIEKSGRGGSLGLATNINEGDTLIVSEPKNEFELQPAPSYILIAGGIGITPIMAMARQLTRTGATPFKIIYCTREPEMTAFADELAGPYFARNVIIHHDNGDPAKVFDFWDTFETPSSAYVYCCGPATLMEEIRGVTGHWPPGAVHFEDFSSSAGLPKEDDEAFVVEHAISGVSIEIPADKTIIEAFRTAGEQVMTSCESGTCGTCKTTLVSGDVDHRDLVLTEEEKKDHIMICVSRALGDKLVLDW